MKKVLASIGIGAATVDTVLPSQTVTPGETVPADVHITGGDVEQDSVDHARSQVTSLIERNL
jgi:sporulation-control protein